MVNHRPIAVEWDTENLISKLIFDENSIAPTGRYLMRGGICFPMMTDLGFSGYAILCGRNMVTKTNYVFEEREFKVINHLIEDEKLIYEGLSSWFPEMWKTYFADTFFFNQDYETQKKYRTQIFRSALANPSPRFLQVRWQDKQQPMHTIFEKDTLGQLKYRSKGGLKKQMEIYSTGETEDLPALHALKCALVGMDKYIIDYDIH